MAEAARLKPLKATPKIRKVTVKMPTQHRTDCPPQILADGYNMRQKSKWVSEAVESLLPTALGRRPGIREGGQAGRRRCLLDSGRADDESESGGAPINAAHPSLNANQSTIIRAAIAPDARPLHHRKPGVRRRTRSDRRYRRSFCRRFVGLR